MTETHTEWIKINTKNIEDYVERKITAKVFQANFFKWWACQEKSEGEKEMAEYYIMHDLFYDLEEFCIYPHLRKEGEINDLVMDIAIWLVSKSRPKVKIFPSLECC